MGCDGCGEASSPRVEPEATATPQPSAPVEPETEAEAHPGAPPEIRARPALTESERAKVAESRRALQAGRELSHAQRWSDAVARFTTSIGASESASARCELGWAHYQLGQFEEARVQLERGVHLLRNAVHRARGRQTNRPSTLGACLYNLGRVAEESDVPAAAAYYRESIAVRPNTTVSARLEALDAPESEVTAGCEPEVCDGPYPSLEAALDDQTIPADPDDPDSGETTFSAETPVTLGALELAQVDSDAGHQYLAIGTGARWFVCPIEEPSDFSDTAVRAPTVHQWIPGGLPEVTVDVEYSEMGHEEGISIGQGRIYRVFVGWSEDRPVVLGGIQVADYSYDGMWTHCEGCERFENGDCCELEDMSEEVRWTLHATGEGRVRAESSNPQYDTATYDLHRLRCDPERDLRRPEGR